jgi:hypothetical protein
MARNTLMRHRRSILLTRDPNEGGGGGTGSGTEGGGGNGTEGGGDTGGGASTDSGKTFSQADLDRIVGERLNRQKAQFADYDELKRKAAEADDLRKRVETADEKAVREAREAAVAEERAKTAPRLVGAEFRAAAKGVLTDAQRDAFLEDADLSKYLTDKGEVDVAKVEAKVKALAPEKQEPKGRVPRDMGQGNRSEGGKASVSSSREDYLERRKKQLGITT